MDLELNIVERKFSTGVYDKRDGFNFHSQFPLYYMDSNIPCKQNLGLGLGWLLKIDLLYFHVSKLQGEALEDGYDKAIDSRGIPGWWHARKYL